MGREGLAATSNRLVAWNGAAGAAGGMDEAEDRERGRLEHTKYTVQPLVL